MEQTVEHSPLKEAEPHLDLETPAFAGQDPTLRKEPSNFEGAEVTVSHIENETAKFPETHATEPDLKVAVQDTLGDLSDTIKRDQMNAIEKG